MKKALIVLVSIGLLCINISPMVFSIQTTNNELNKERIVEPKEIIQKKENYFSLATVEKTYTNDFGIWVHTKYDGLEDSKKLEIDLVTFKLMLESGGWRYYTLNFGPGQSTVGLQFSRTQIYVEGESDPYVDVVQTEFSFETTSDTTVNYEVSLEVRFPFSLLEKKSKSFSIFENLLINIIKNLKNDFFKNIFEKILFRFNEKTGGSDVLNSESESYFCVRIGFASPEGDQGPSRVESRFFFGRNSIWDPKVFRMQITPYDLGGEYKLSYFNSYLTVSDSGSEAFNRVFSVDFEPAAELQITSIPSRAKISYSFGSSAGTATKISFSAEGGTLSNIIQSFLIDPLPSYMTFDLTVLGERSFKYESDNKYSVTYMMDSIEEDELVKVELESLPKTITAEWGLKVALLDKTVLGFINLDISSDLSCAAVSLFDSDTPFMEVVNFPEKLDISAYLDVPNLNGYVSANKLSSGTTTNINVPIRWDKWEITGNLHMNNGYGYASFNLPDSSSNYVSVGLDTNGNSLFGLGITIVDTSISKQVLQIGVDGVATDDFGISFNYNSSSIQNFGLTGKITELIDFVVSIDYSAINLDLSTSWTIGQGGIFELEVNKDLIIDLSQLELGDTKINGAIGMYEGGSIDVEWGRGQIGFFKVTTEGFSFNPEIELSMSDTNSNEMFLDSTIVLNPSCIVNFDWEWGQTGHFTVYTNDLLEEVFIDTGYHYDPTSDEYQYGFKLNAADVNIKRTIQWDTQDGHIPRIWILGDNPLPGGWDVWLLWNYEWYEVK
ncbi:MAG: hypothetical protein MUO82_04620 [Candidatus Thermoplasmatota archaeon]|nr:hypothetical protein [Candidatus Thermoplasmatota archaeon]